MNSIDKVAVCSRSFSRNLILRNELLENYKNVTFNDQGISLKGQSLINFLSGHDKAIIALEVISQEVLSELPNLKVISKYGVGVDTIDLELLASYSINFGWTGGVNKRSVSELVISFAISLLRQVPMAHRQVVEGVWKQCVGGLLSNKVVGIIGCGFIGKDVIRLLQPFGCKIIVNDIKNFEDFYQTYDIESVTLDQLLIRADVVSLHVPLNESTFRMLNAEKLKMLKPDSILINLARGGLIDESYLKYMLINQKLAGAALDVFYTEPPEDSELLSLPNLIVTPHIGGSSIEAILAMGRAAINGLDVQTLPNSSC